MYIYSLAAFLLTLYLYPHIRRASPWQNLLLAHFYILDTAVNTIWTAGFGVAWFWVLAAHKNNQDNRSNDNSGGGQAASKIPGGGTIDETAGFTDPVHQNISKVGVIGLDDQQSTITYGTGEGGSFGSAFFQSGSIASISVVVALLVLRIYFILVVLAYARLCLRTWVASTSGGHEHNGTGAWGSVDPLDTTGNLKQSKSEGDLAENPFANSSRPESEGWRGKLGRAMLSIAPSYWLGPDKDEEWARGMRGTFLRKQNQTTGLRLMNFEMGSVGAGTDRASSDGGSTAPGTVERERRRRSGTGPPVPSVTLPKFVGES
jgi:inositol phosphorylceramide synthase regulatory subunit